VKESGVRRYSNGPRKSFHEPTKAKTAIAAMTGRARGRAM
jgi:hypothetical protein